MGGGGREGDGFPLSKETMVLFRFELGEDKGCFRLIGCREGVSDLRWMEEERARVSTLSPK